MSWAKVTGNAWLFHDVSPATFPTDLWGQVDVWIPPETFTACFDGDLFGFSAYFLDFGISAIRARRIQPGPWTWITSFGNVAASGPASSTTYTIKFHYYSVGPGFSQGQVDWYVNGTLIATDAGANKFTEHLLFLNHFPEGCCCEIYYYTDARLGTSDGGTEIFSDDFSGGLGAWTENVRNQPGAITVVAAPSAAPCPTLTASPVRGQAETTFTLGGFGFAPGSPLTLTFADTPISDFAATADGAGNFTTTLPVPEGLGAGANYDITVADDAANVACAQFRICGAITADGITTAPDPLVATGGITNNANLILDYVFHDGAHWVLWQDESAITDTGTFPPPANHTMNATRISADGSSVVDYPIDTDYQWIFGGGDVNDEGLFSSRRCPGSGTTVSAPVWSQKSFFASWAKPVYDAHFASDGSSLWVAVVTRETVPYPWLDNLDACDPNPGSAAQFVTLAALTSGFTVFATDTSTGYHRWNTQTTGVIDFYEPNAFPVTDAGEEDMGYWSPYVVVMFSFDGATFDRIGQIEAKYAPGITNGTKYGNQGIIGTPPLQQKGPRGTLASRVSICASPNDPGVCHVVWSEGGDWGRQGLAAGDCTRLVWDAGPQNRDYRVNYTQWSPSAKIFDTDIFSSHVDRTNWYFQNDLGLGGGEYVVGYTWPDQADFAGLLVHDLRNDNPAGAPLLFAAAPQSLQNAWNPFTLAFQPPPAYIDSGGHPWLDNAILYSDTLHVYDLGSGSAVLAQSLDLTTLAPTTVEVEHFWNPGYGPCDCLYGPTQVTIDRDSVNPVVDFGPTDKAFGISLPYDDPELGVPVYLVHVPLAKRWIPRAGSPIEALSRGQAAMRGFYRVPCDMSTGFDFLDGTRQLNFTILKEPYTDSGSGVFGSSDFFSDAKNIWVPGASGGGFGFGGFPGLWFDRICVNTWETFDGAWTPFVSHYSLGAECPGFHYDPAADSITVATAASLAEPAAGPLFAAVTQFICRGCRNCKCATGINIAHRF